MPALTQIRFNAACLLCDCLRLRRHWRKIPFHWRGLKRACTLTTEHHIALQIARALGLIREHTLLFP